MVLSVIAIIKINKQLCATQEDCLFFFYTVEILKNNVNIHVKFFWIFLIQVHVLVYNYTWLFSICYDSEKLKSVNLFETQCLCTRYPEKCPQKMRPKNNSNAYLGRKIQQPYFAFAFSFVPCAILPPFWWPAKWRERENFAVLNENKHASSNIHGHTQISGTPWINNC